MPEGNLFSEWLLDLHSRETSKMKSAKEVHDIFRAQGSVGILDVLMRIKSDLRDYLNDIREGRAVPITDAPKEVASNGMARQYQR